MDVRYVPGSGVLLGAGNRWLLLDAVDAADEGEEGLLDGLWDLLTTLPFDAEQVLAAVEGHGDPQGSLVLVDLTPGSESTLTRGTGRLSTLGGVRSLALGDPDNGSERPSRRLVAGIVAASAAQLRPSSKTIPAVRMASPVSEAVPIEGLINAIPPEILGAREVDPPAAPTRAPTPAEAAPLHPVEPSVDGARPVADSSRTTRRDPTSSKMSAQPGELQLDHDGSTIHRDALVDHLHQHTRETVLAAWCEAGHVTAAYTPTCRVCELPVPPQDPQRMPRPQLGVLRLPDGREIPLDRGVVFGRAPSAPAGDEDWPRLVGLPPSSTYVSRTHLRIELDGWLVLATDLGSRGGTTLRVAGRAPERLRGHERYVWEPGQVLDLADCFEIVYEVDRQ